MDPGAKARGADRESAVRLVREACAQGRITELDRDFRIRAIESAQTLGEVEVHVRDLRARAVTDPVAPGPVTGPAEPDPTTAGSVSASEPPAWARSSAVSSWPPAGAGPGGVQEPAEAPAWPPRAPAVHVPPPPPRTGLTLTKVVLIVVAVFFCCGIGSLLGSMAFIVGSITDAVRDGMEDTSIAPRPESADLLTEEGYDELVALVREETGSSRVLRADIYTDHVSFDVLRPDGETSVNYRWGSMGLQRLSERPHEGDTRPLDLAGIDGAVIEKLSDRAERTLFEDPDRVHTKIWRSRPGEPGVIWSYARQGDQTAYLLSRADGSLVRRSD